MAKLYYLSKNWKFLLILISFYHLEVAASRGYCQNQEWMIHRFDDSKHLKLLRDTVSIHKDGNLTFSIREGGTQISYVATQTESWGGYASTRLSPFNSTQLGFELSECSHLQLSTKVIEPQSSVRRAHFRVNVIDASNCEPDTVLFEDFEHYNCNQASSAESYYSFHPILDRTEAEGWSQVQVELRGGSDSDLPLWLTGWTGIIGNNKLDLEFIRSIVLEISIDDSGEVPSDSHGILIIRDLSCINKPSMAKLLDLPFNQSSVFFQDDELLPEIEYSQVLSENSTNPLRDFSIASQFKIASERPWLNLQLQKQQGSESLNFNTESAGLDTSFFDWTLADQADMAFVMNFPQNTTLKFYLQDSSTVRLNLIECMINETLVIKNNLALDFINFYSDSDDHGGHALGITIDLKVALNGNLSTVFDLGHVAKYGIEVSHPNPLVLDSFSHNEVYGSLGIVAPFTLCDPPVPFWKGGMEPFVEKCYTEENANLFPTSYVAAEKVNFMGTSERCCAVLLQSATSRFGVKPVNDFACFLYSSITEPAVASVVPLEVRLDEGGREADRPFLWKRAVEDVACTSNITGNFTGICDCSSTWSLGEEQLILDCSNRGLQVVPYIDRFTALKVVELDLRGNAISFISHAMMTPLLKTENPHVFPRLKVLRVSGNGIQYFEHQVLDDMPVLKTLELLDEGTYPLDAWVSIEKTRNFRNGTQEDFSNICCEASIQTLANTGNELEFCTIRRNLDGAEDCSVNPYFEYRGGSSKLREITLSSELGAFAESKAKCCNLCAMARDCKYYMYDVRAGNAEPRCNILKDFETAIEERDDASLSADGGPGYISGATPQTRYQLGEGRCLVSGDTENGYLLDQGSGFSTSVSVRLSSAPYRGNVIVSPVFYGDVLTGDDISRDRTRAYYDSLVISPSKIRFDKTNWNTTVHVHISLNDTIQNVLARCGRFADDRMFALVPITLNVDSCDSAFEFIDPSLNFETLSIEIPEVEDNLATWMIGTGVSLTVISIIALVIYRRRLEQARKAFAAVVFQEVVLHTIGILFEIADIMTDFQSLRQVWAAREANFTVAVAYAVVFGVGVQISLYCFYERYKYSRQLEKVVPIGCEDTESEWEVRALFLQKKITLDCKSRFLLVIVGAFEDFPMVILNTYVLTSNMLGGVYLQVLLSYLISGTMLGYKVTVLRRIKDSTQTLEELASMRKVAAAVLKTTKEGAVSRDAILKEIEGIERDERRRSRTHSMEWAKVDMSKVNLSSFFVSWASEHMQHVSTEKSQKYLETTEEN